MNFGQFKETIPFLYYIMHVPFIAIALLATAVFWISVRVAYDSFTSKGEYEERSGQAPIEETELLEKVE